MARAKRKGKRIYFLLEDTYLFTRKELMDARSRYKKLRNQLKPA